MDEFFAAYGLYLLIGLLLLIVAIFLLSGRKGRSAAPDAMVEAPPAAAPLTTPAEVIEPAPVADPIVAEPIVAEPVVVEPAPTVPVAPPAPAASAPIASVSVPPTPAPLAPAAGLEEGADNLMRMKGVGPKLAAQLNALGVTRYAQIAAWTASDIAAVDAQLGAFKGRPIRDQWVDQAKYLASGDIAGFEAKYGKV